MEWKTITRCPNYEVSETGRVRRIDGREKVLTVAANGYLVVNLWMSNKGAVFLVHDLVAEAFIGPRPLGHHINHIDADRQNPSAHNLEYTTPKGNIQHCVSLDRHARGQRNGHAKLTDEQANEIYRRANAGEATKDLASEFGVRSPIISQIKHRTRWRHIHRECLL